MVIRYHEEERSHFEVQVNDTRQVDSPVELTFVLLPARHDVQPCTATTPRFVAFFWVLWCLQAAYVRLRSYHVQP